MKKLMVSLAAAPLLLSAVASADVDVKVGGQAVIYYETQQSGADEAPDMFDQDASQANVGVQLNMGADLGNNFTFGSQLSYLGTLGLEKNLVSGVKQVGGQVPVNALNPNYNTTDELALTKLFVAKKVGNTTVKLGRQELPKSLSPLAFSEGWNVFKNTFDAALAINSDLPKTTLVGAWVSASNSTVGTGLSKMNDIAGVGGYTGGAYMLTAQTKLIPLTTLTLTYYDVVTAAHAFWADAAVGGKSLPMGIKLGLQFGMLMPEADNADDTTAFGIKAGATVGPVYLQAAYSSVDDGAMAVKNVGTGIKTPLYTQMIYNQNAIARDADTFVIKGVYNTGDYGKIIAQYGMTMAGDTNNINGENDYNELDLIYKVKAGGVTYWASAMIINTDEEGGIIGAPGADNTAKLRLWGRYNF
jgi:hypothetical protein